MEPEKEIYLDNVHEMLPDRGEDWHPYVRCWKENSIEPGGTAMLHQNEFGDYWCDFCQTTFPQPDPALSTSAAKFDAMGRLKLVVRNDDGSQSLVSL